MDAAAIEVETGTDTDAICIIVTSLHCVLEDQGRTTATRNQSGVTCGATDIQCQAGRTSDLQALARIDAKAQYIASLVAAVRRQHHAADHRHNRIHLDTRGSAHIVQSHIGIVAHRVAQNRAVEVERGTESDAVGIELALLDGQTKCQSAAVGLALEECERGLTITQVHLDARRQTVAGQQYVLVQGHGEVEVLPGHIGTICGHGDAGDGRSDSVDAVTGTTQAGVEGVARHVEDAGTAAVEVKAQGSGPGYAADGDLVSARVNLLQDAQAALGSAGANQGKVVQVHSADAFAEGHGVAHAAGIARGRVERDNGAGRRRHGIHDDAAGGADVVQRQVHAVAGRIAQGGTVGEETGHADAIGVVVAGLDGVVEHQRRAAGTRDEVGEHRVAADVQGQLRNPIDQHRFAGVDHEGQGIPGIVGSTSRHTDAADRGHHRIDQHAGRACHAVQLAIDDVADAVAQGAAVGLDGRAKADAIGIELTIGCHQAEHQCAGAAATEVLGEDGAAAVEGHGDARYAASGVDRDVLTEVDGEVEVLSRHVGAAGRHADAGDRGRYAIDHDIAAATEGVHAAHGRQRQDRRVAVGVGQRRAVELQGSPALEVQVGADVSSLHGVPESQGVAARATHIDRIAIDQAGFQQQAGNAAIEIDEDRLVELDKNQDLVAHLVAAIRAAGTDTDDSWVGLLHRDQDEVTTGLAAAASGLPQVVADDLQRGRAVVAGRRAEAHTGQSMVDIGETSIEGDGAVSGTTADAERQAGDAAQSDRPVDGGECHPHGSTAYIHVRNGNQVAVADAEEQRLATKHRLASRYAVHRGVVHRADGQVEGARRIHVAAHTGITKIIEPDRHGNSARCIGRRKVAHRAAGDESVDISQGATEHERVGARARQRHAGCRQRTEGAAAGQYAETCLDLPGTGVDIAEADAGQHQGYVLAAAHWGRRHHGEVRDIVHPFDVQCQAAAAGLRRATAVTQVTHADVEGDVAVVVRQRPIGQVVAGKVGVDVVDPTGEDHAVLRRANCDRTADRHAQGAAAGRERESDLNAAQARIDVGDGNAGNAAGGIFKEIDHTRQAELRGVVGGSHGHRARGHGTLELAIMHAEADAAGGGVRGVRAVAVGHRAQRRLPLCNTGAGHGGENQSAGAGVVAADDVTHGGRVAGEAERILHAVEVAGDTHRGAVEQRRIAVRYREAAIDYHRRGSHVRPFDESCTAAAAGDQRRIVDSGNGDAGGVADQGERRGAAGTRSIYLGALLAGSGAALVPRLEREVGGCAINAIGNEAHPVAAAQQQRIGGGDRSHILPAGAVVHAVLPGAEARVQIGNGNPLQRAAVHIADVASDEAGNRLPGIVDVSVGQPVQ
ncbi:hypothetical protein APV28_2639 [Comamonas testosteroni]|nr:hypothetical protein APV28_2639 [Comamonas testosteroni]